ncbi:HXXEE domain-containing protein [Priestia aryabhattai]|uniref:HXXEE domain-containing protein n=1 Tax=Priestia aryabhattai TaxID=412384 RepID=UPI003D2C4FB7
MIELELYNVLWLFVVVFMLHDFEEIITVEKWAKAKEAKIKLQNKWISHKIWEFWNISPYAFAKRDVFIFLFMSLITFMKVLYLESYWSSILFVGFLIFVLVHNLIHLLQTLFIKAYTPGLYTAVLLVTPYTAYLLYRLKDAALI